MIKTQGCTSKILHDELSYISTLLPQLFVANIIIFKIEILTSQFEKYLIPAKNVKYGHRFF